MTRSVVFKTPGNFDVRSLTVMGLNSKPNTGHPIGFFGTGLKYSIAVLARHNIPITFYIFGTKWTVEAEESNFRGKHFKQLVLRRHRKLMGLGKSIPLPFTTELGKTWKLWQAFRELESNTRDEKGETFIGDKEALDYDERNNPEVFKHSTIIRVESEDFVQEYYDREKTFLPEGLTQREGTENVQIFDRPSRCIYYRGIRVMDLPENESSELTYNILSPIELTEDRTAKDAFYVKYAISQAVASLKDKDQITKVVKAPQASYESKNLNYSWGTPSKTFLDTIEEMPDEEVSYEAKSTLKAYRPPPPKPKDTRDWIEPIIEALRHGDEGDIISALQDHHAEVIQILTIAQTTLLKELSNNEQVRDEGTRDVHDDGREVEVTAAGGTIGPIVETFVQDATKPMARGGLNDDIPF